MPISNFVHSFPYPDFMPTGFNGDPEEALVYARSRQTGRYNVEAIRAALVFFDGWRPESAALPWVERLLGLFPVAETRGARGPAREPQSLLDMKSLAVAVNGTCLSSSGLHKLADEVVSRAGRCFTPSTPIQAVLDTRHAPIVLRLFRFTEAQELADRSVEFFSQGDEQAEKAIKPFCCRHTALLARGLVRGARYSPMPMRLSRR